MRTPRTRAEILADPRVAKVGDPLVGERTYTLGDIIWQEYDGCFDTDTRCVNAYWVALADGWTVDDCATVHEATLRDIGLAIASAEFNRIKS